MPDEIVRIITPRWIVPVVPAGVILEHHSLVINQHSIIDLLPSAQAKARYAGAQETVLDQQLLMPGMVNAHGHAAMTLLRGYADDLEMMDWLTNNIWPVEGKLVDERFVLDGTRLAAAEMIRTGTTCAADTYFFPEAAAKGFLELKFRAQVGLPVLSFANAWAKDEDEHIHLGLAFRDSIKNKHLISTAFAPHSPYSVTDRGFEKVVLYAQQLELPIHLHLHETETEINDAVKTYGIRPIARMQQLGVISPALQAVHVTQLREDEITLFADNGVQVVHCPESNMKLASGFCPVDGLINRGVNVALGTDGAASNNDLDMVQEARSASFLAKAITRNPTTLHAHQLLHMMTLAGARFLGLDDKIGSLEKGKLADIVTFDLSRFALQPVYDPVSQIAYAATGQDVSHVWINGELLLDRGQFTECDITGILADTAVWQARIQAVANE